MKLKRLLLFLLMTGNVYFVNTAILTNLRASSHESRFFIIRESIATPHKVPIDNSSVQRAVCPGRVDYNFGFDYRLWYSDPPITVALPMHPEQIQEVNS